MTFQMHRFIECIRGDGRLGRTGGHLSWRTKDEAMFRVKGAVYSNKYTSFALNIMFNMRLCFIEARFAAGQQATRRKWFVVVTFKGFLFSHI